MKEITRLLCLMKLEYAIETSTLSKKHSQFFLLDILPPNMHSRIITFVPLFCKIPFILVTGCIQNGYMVKPS